MQQWSPAFTSANAFPQRRAAKAHNRQTVLFIYMDYSFVTLVVVATERESARAGVSRLQARAMGRLVSHIQNRHFTSMVWLIPL